MSGYWWYLHLVNALIESCVVFSVSKWMPPCGAMPTAADERTTTRTSEPGWPAVFSSTGVSNFVNSACPRWLEPNCSSYPSRVSPRGVAMQPAFSIKMSRLCEELTKVRAAALMESKDSRSMTRGLITASGTSFLISLMAFSAFSELRAVSQISFGSCRASSSTDCLPRPCSFRSVT